MSKQKLDLLKLDKVPTWITQDNIEKMKSDDFQQIVRFFVINTPDKITSARGIEIVEYGYDDEEKLFKELIGNIPCQRKNQSIERSDLKAVNMLEFPPTDMNESMCFAVSNSKPVTSLFIKIRDSLAHGRFNIGGSPKMPFLVMEDINKHENCSARIILKVKTLKSWIMKLEGVKHE